MIAQSIAYLICTLTILGSIPASCKLLYVFWSVEQLYWNMLQLTSADPYLYLIKKKKISLKDSGFFF